MVKLLTYGELLKKTLHFLPSDGYCYRDIQYLLMQYKHWNLTDFLSHQQDAVCDEDILFWKDAVPLLKQQYPIQYIVGYETFYDRSFYVTPDTLIPRPETEWMVEYCLQHEASDATLTVVDVGTGSGAIAITLKKECPHWHVIATDISPHALAIAKKNAIHLKADIDCRQGDVLSAITTPVDLIISNPPYIDEEDESVQDNVRCYEPSLALFANHQGYAIYEKLAIEAQTLLAKHGRIYLEIGYNQGERVQNIFQQAFPDKHVTVHKDYSGCDRLVVVTP